MKVKNLILVTIFSFLIENVVFSQDVVFSQYYASSVALNPALAGTETSASVSVNSRSQWSTLDNGYLSNQIAIIIPFKSHAFNDVPAGAFGFSFLNDGVSSGAYKTNGGYFTFAYNVTFNEKSVLALGAQGGMVFKSLDLAKYDWNSDYFPGIGDIGDSYPGLMDFKSSKSFVDFGGGALFSSEISDKNNIKRGLFFGASAYHLNQPNQSFIETNSDKLAMRINVQGGVDFGLGENLTLSPNFLFVNQLETQINVGSYLKYHVNPVSTPEKEILLGAWYRVQDSFIMLVGYNSKTFSAGFSYDLNTSSLKTYSNGLGAYELFFKLRAPSKKRERHFNPRM